MLLAHVLGAQGRAQTAPPWSKGANDPATDKGYVFQVPDVDNIPDLHGNPAGAELVLLIGGNPLFLLPPPVFGVVARAPGRGGEEFFLAAAPGFSRQQETSGRGGHHGERDAAGKYV